MSATSVSDCLLMELRQCRLVWLQPWSVSMLFEWRLASMSLRQTYMLHVNVTRMFDPNRTEAANSSLVLSWPCTQPMVNIHCWGLLATNTVWNVSFFPHSCFLFITISSSFPASPSLFPPPFWPHFFPFSLPLPFPSLLPTSLLLTPDYS